MCKPYLYLIKVLGKAYNTNSCGHRLWPRFDFISNNYKFEITFKDSKNLILI